MTFLQFCHKQYIAENDRLVFKQYLGSKTKGEKAPAEWWQLFLEFQEWLLKRSAKGE